MLPDLKLDSSAKLVLKCTAFELCFFATYELHMYTRRLLYQVAPVLIRYELLVGSLINFERRCCDAVLHEAVLL